MQFVINNTPPIRKSKKQENEAPPEPPSYLVLMPFQPPAKVFFENIKIGREVKRIVKIRNPSANPIIVALDKLPDPKIGLSLSQTDFIVESQGEVIVNVEFKPLVEGSGRECIHVKDVNKNKKISDIFINWSSLDPNPPKFNKKKKPLCLETKILTQNKVVAKKSGVKNVKVAPKPKWKSTWPVEVNKSKKLIENSQDFPRCNVLGTPPRRQTYVVENKENLDTNSGTYSNKRTRNPHLRRSTVLSPLPLLTKGRLKVFSKNDDIDSEKYDAFSTDFVHKKSFKCGTKKDAKVKECEARRNLQVSEELLHLGDDEIVYLGETNPSKQILPKNNLTHERRDTYLVENEQIANSNRAESSYVLPNDRRDTFLVDSPVNMKTSRKKVKGSLSDVYNLQHNVSTHSPINIRTKLKTVPMHLLREQGVMDEDFNGAVCIEEEYYTEMKVIRTPLYKRNSFERRRSFAKQSFEQSDSFEKCRKSIEKHNGKLRIKRSSLGKMYNEFRRRSSDRFSIDSLEGDHLNLTNEDGFVDVLNDFDVDLSPMPLAENFNPRRTSTGVKQVQQASMKTSEGFSKKKLNLLNENTEQGIKQKDKTAFHDSINTLKSTAHDIFETLLNGIRPLDDDKSNLSADSLMTDATQNGKYVCENGSVRHLNPKCSTNLGETYAKHQTMDRTFNMKPGGFHCETFIKHVGREVNQVSDLGSTFSVKVPNQTFLVESEASRSHGFYLHDVDAHKIDDQLSRKTDPQSVVETPSEQTVKVILERDSLENVSVEDIGNELLDDEHTQKSNDSMQKNATFDTPCTAEEPILVKEVDVTDHAPVLIKNPLRTINETMSSIEFDVLLYESKQNNQNPIELSHDYDDPNRFLNTIAECSESTVVEHTTALHRETSSRSGSNDMFSCSKSSTDISPASTTPHESVKTSSPMQVLDVAKTQSYPVANEILLAKKNDSDASKTIQIGNQNIPKSNEKLRSRVHSTPSLSLNTTVTNNSMQVEKTNIQAEPKTSKPTVWTIDISPPSKLVEEKRQPGAYDFLIKYPQPRPDTRTIRKPTYSSRTTTKRVSSIRTTKKVINEPAHKETVHDSAQKQATKVSIEKFPSQPDENVIRNSVKSGDLKVKSDQSLNSSTSSSSDRSKTTLEFLETSGGVTSAQKSVSRKRRSNSSVESVEKRRETSGPPPGKVLRTTSDVFKRPDSKQEPPARTSSVGRAARLPMKSLSLGRKKKQREESVQFYNPEKIISDYTDSNLLIATENNATPFSIGSLYMDPKVLDDLERDNIKWLNSLLTPPIELECDAEGVWCVDIADLWLKSSRTQNVELAPSREKTAMKYHGQQDRLDALRKAAFQLFRSKNMSPVLSKLSMHISKNLIEVRKDRDLHLDQGLQQKVIQLLLCYNPLWLRIGLEAVYGCTVPLHHNNDVIGLTTFMRKHLVNDPYTRKQHSHPKVPNLMAPTFRDAMKKFILRKFLMVVYFLDRAKTTKLIRHDPCLFNKKSIYKDSAQILIEFSRDLVSGGDILRHLRTFGYIVEHKQTFLDEFDFSTKRLLDLRDGVRLTRAMEIILHKKHLTKKLRAPAISRLQKVHNVEVSLSALENAGYDIQDDISAKDIADGHREKTLSLLWQIIYKFQAPRYAEAARKIQIWWKSKSLLIEIRKRIRAKLLVKQNAAASVIQSRWKGILTRRRFFQMKESLKEEKAQRLHAAIVIQKHYRAHKAKYHFNRLKSNAIKIQRYFRAHQRQKQINTDRDQFVRMREAAIVIQRSYRNYKLGAKCWKQFEKIRHSAILIQTWYRSVKQMRIDRNYYLAYRNSVIKCQQTYRAIRQMKQDRSEFIRLRRSVIIVQKAFRAYRTMIVTRTNFVSVQKSAISVQRAWRRYVTMRNERNRYLKLKQCVVTIQRRFRADRRMKKDRCEFEQLKRAVVTIQIRYRAHVHMKTQRSQFLVLKDKAIYIQKKFRANELMKRTRAQFVHTIKSVTILQQRFRGYLQMKRTRLHFLRVRNGVLTLQRRFRANQLMQSERINYVKKVSACVLIQRRVRAYLIGKKVRTNYLRLKKCVLLVQRTWRCKQLTSKCRQAFSVKRASVVQIQAYFRMYRQRCQYKRLRTSAITIQTYVRNYFVMKQARFDYNRLKHSAIVIQKQWRGMVRMRQDREKFLRLKKSTIYVQNRFRAIRLARIIRAEYLSFRKAAVYVQTKVRTYLAMRKERAKYLQIRSSILKIQSYYRASRQRNQYKQDLRLKKCVRIIENRYVAYKQMMKQREHYLNMKRAVVCIEKYYYARLLMMRRRNEFLRMKEAVLKIEQMYLVCRERHTFLELRFWTVIVQRRYRFKRNMKKYENIIVALKQKREQEKAQMWRHACATKIQSVWRRYKVRKQYADILEKKKEKAQTQSNQMFENQEPLHVRLDTAIGGIEEAADLFHVIKSVYNLDTITTLSPKLCVEFTNKGLIELLFSYLQSANRSEPYKNLSIGILRVFINLARFDLTAPVLWRITLMMDGIITIANLLKIWYAKNDELFCAAATLLWLFTLKPEHAEVIKSTEIATKKIMYCYNELVKKKPKSVSKTPLTLPGHKADWGLGYRRKVFTNPLYAVSTVCKKLALLEDTTGRMSIASNPSRSMRCGIPMKRSPH